jgi:hypothetical protein
MGDKLLDPCSVAANASAVACSAKHGGSRTRDEK